MTCKTRRTTKGSIGGRNPDDYYQSRYRNTDEKEIKQPFNRRRTKEETEQAEKERKEILEKIKNGEI